MEATETTTQPAAPAAQPNAEAAVDHQERITKLEAQLKKMESDNFKLREDRRALKQQLPPVDAAEKAKADEARAARIERQALKALIGKPIPSAEHADFIVWKALNTPTVIVNDDGSVEGLDDVVSAYVGKFAPAPPAPAVAPQPAAPTPPIARPSTSAEPIDAAFAAVKTTSDLTKLGPAAVLAFRTKFPERYAELVGNRR